MTRLTFDAVRRVAAAKMGARWAAQQIMNALREHGPLEQRQLDIVVCTTGKRLGRGGERVWERKENAPTGTDMHNAVFDLVRSGRIVVLGRRETDLRPDMPTYGLPEHQREEDDQ